jgi:Aerotolerance regulator N-terminal/von Willebrand factor type A domain
MAFVAPLILVGLGALAIPVLIHLIQRERKRVVEFPSLMFLRKIPYQSVRRRRVRDWLLLLMRLAALALIVLAFARPFFRRSALAAAAQNGAREAVILVDTSYSMEYGDRWQKGKTAAAAAIRALGPGDRASLVFFASGAEVAVRSAADKGRLEAALATAATGPGATRYAPALKLAGSLLGESALPRREIVLISDFQRRGWEQTPGRDDVKLPDRTTLSPINVAAGDTANLSVTPVSLQRTRFENHDRVVVTAGLVNHGAKPVTGAALALEIDGNAIQSLPADVAPGGSSSVTFAPFTVASRNMRGTVRLPADGLARDNVFHFVVSPSEPVHAIVVNRSGADREALYLSRALAISETPRVELQTRTPATVTEADLRGAAVVLLNDVEVTDELADRLGRFVAAGGGVLVAAGPHASWPAHAAALMPALPGQPVDRTTTTPSRLGGLEYSHPLFELFRAPRTGDFSAARFYGYRAVENSTGLVLARFDDGTPALMETKDRKPGGGRVLLWNSTLDLEWNDLPVKPVFLPFVHTLTKYLADFAEPAASLTVGQVIPAPRKAAGRGTAAARGGTIAIAPSGARVSVETEDGALELAEQGFYDVRTQGAAADSATTLASNVDLSESDLSPLDPRELAAAVAGRAAGDNASLGETRPSDDAQAQAQRLWWYLLVAGGLLLAGETLLSNRLSQNGARVS